MAINLEDMPLSVVNTIGKHLPTNQDRCSLSMTSRALHQAMNGFLWGSNEYEGLAPHRPLSEAEARDPAIWLQLNRERSTIGSRAHGSLHPALKRMLLQHQPDRVLATLTKSTSLPYRYHDKFRAALQQQGRCHEQWPFDHGRALHQRWKQAIKHLDRQAVLELVAAKVPIDKDVVRQRQQRADLSFWAYLLEQLRATGSVDAIETVATDCNKAKVRAMALDFLHPASARVLASFERQEDHPVLLSALVGHLTSHRLAAAQSRLIWSLSQGTSATKGASLAAQKLSALQVDPGVILGAEQVVVPAWRAPGLFSCMRAARRGARVPAERIDSIVDLYLRHHLMPVEDNNPSLAFAARGLRPHQRTVEAQPSHPSLRLTHEDVVRLLSERSLRRLGAAGLRLSTKQVLSHLYLPGALDPAPDAELKRLQRMLADRKFRGRLAALDRAGVWRRPTAGQFKDALGFVMQRRRDFLR